MPPIFHRVLFLLTVVISLAGPVFGASGPVVARLLADPARPRVYAIRADGIGAGSLQVLDSVTHATVRSIPLGNKPTDCSIGDGGKTLFVIQAVDKTIVEIDLDTLTVAKTRTLTEYTNWGAAETHAHVLAGKGNILYYVDGQWGPRLRVYDRATGNVLQTFGMQSMGTDNDDGIGGLAMSPDGSAIYTWKQYGWTAGVLGTYLRKFNVLADGKLAPAAQTASSRSTNFDRDPLDTPALLTADGSRLIVKDRAFSTSNIHQVSVIYPDEIYSITPGGEIAGGATAIYSGESGEILYTLPVASPVQAMLPDYSAMVYVNPVTQAVVWLDLVATLGTEALGLEILPADGAAIAQPELLKWIPVTGIANYQIYLGTVRSDVDAATPTSATYLGESVSNSIALPAALTVGQTYYWRVVPVDASGQIAGPGITRSFRVSNLSLSHAAIQAETVEGVKRNLETIHLDSTTPLAWSVTADQPWIKFVNSSGTTPEDLILDLDASTLTAGIHEGRVTLNTAGDSIEIPVKLRVMALNIIKLVAHPSRPLVYGISASAVGSSYLLEIDAATAAILRSMPVGLSPTDADLDAVNDRLYVSNWGFPRTQVVDVANWRALPALSLGDDVYKINVTSSGKVITEEQDQWINLSLWDVASGMRYSSSPSVREGDGEADPTGKFYYHADNNISDAHLTKYDISGNNFVGVAKGPEVGYGSRNLILSEDGSRLFWNKRVFDAGLAMLGQSAGEVYATNRNGGLAIGESLVWWSSSGSQAAVLPFASKMAAVSSGDSYLVRFNGTTGKLVSTAVSDVTDLPGPMPRPGELLDGSPERISWSPVAGATAYRVFIAGDADELAGMTKPVATVGTTYYEFPSPLGYGGFYSWRVDTVRAGAVTTGVVRSFGILFPEGPPVPVINSGSVGAAVSISDRHFLVGGQGAAQLYDFDPVAAAVSPVQSFTLPGHYTVHEFGAAVAMDAGKASVGAPSYENPLDGGGAAFVYRMGSSGYWESNGPLTPPVPVANDGYGRGLAASGNMMLVGLPATRMAGRVTAYLTEPSALPIQTFGTMDGERNDQFGRAIVMEGNQSIIAAPGPGVASARKPCLYAFSRSLVTGFWTESQKIPISGAGNSSNSGTVLALSGDRLATTNNSTGAVVIFARNAAGQWEQSGSIARQDVPGSSYYFGGSLAFSGDRLFVGDLRASNGGKSGGVVFSFRKSGDHWVAGPVITPANSHYVEFGAALAARDGWLLAAGQGDQAAWLFRVEDAPVHTPGFVGKLPSQVVAGRPLSTEIHADDADGNDGLAFDLLQGPDWMDVSTKAGGKAVVSGTPAGNSGDTHTVQIRVRDVTGAQALHTYQLTLLAADDFPVLTQVPAATEAGEGQEVVLRAGVSGTGPFQWQWYRDGKPIAGATRSSLVIAEVALADAGSYQVRVSNVVGEIESTPVRMDVHPANPVAGDWPTFGGSPRHTGYQPARLGNQTFVPGWSREITPGHPLNRAATGGGRVFVTPNIYFGGSFAAMAMDLETGDPVWSHAFAEAFSLNPPTYHDGRVYIQRGNHESDTQLWALDATSGEAVWSSPHGAQWERYEAPAVTDDGIWVNGGSYGGMYGFSLAGSQSFFESLAQFDGWVPTVSDNRLFSWVAGEFREHNPGDGSTLWSLATGSDLGGWGIPTVSAVTGDSAVVISGPEIICIDLPTRSIRWRSPGNFSGSPAIAGNRVFAIQGNSVFSYGLFDGTWGPTADLPATLISAQPLVLIDHLFVASETETYVIDSADMSLKQTLAGGGLLSYAGGRLLVAGTDGTLRTWVTNEAPKFAASLPRVIHAATNAATFRLDLASHSSDPDAGDSLSWAVVTPTLPDIFKTFQVDPATGILSVAYNPYFHGSATMRLAVIDQLGNRTVTDIEFILPEHAQPKLRINPKIRFNRATGLYEQKVVVKNLASRAIAGFRLKVSGLGNRVKLRNGIQAVNGGGTYLHDKPVAAGKSVAVILEYFPKRRGTVKKPTILCTILEPARRSTVVPDGGIPLEQGTGSGSVNSGVTQTSGSVTTQISRTDPADVARWIASIGAARNIVVVTEEPFVISGFKMLPGEAPEIEFQTEPGREYRVQYCDDLVNWKTCPEIITHSDTVSKWIDSGPPLTEIRPSDAPVRYYRVERLAPQPLNPRR